MESCSGQNHGKRSQVDPSELKNVTKYNKIMEQKATKFALKPHGITVVCQPVVFI